MKLQLVILQILYVTRIRVTNAKQSFDYEYLPNNYDDIPNLTSSISVRAHNVDLNNSLSYNGTLHKCRCGVSYAWDGSVCVETPAKVIVFERWKQQIALVDSDHFNEVMVGEPQCPSQHLLVTLDSSRNLDHQFSLLPSGHLYWYQREFDLYCIDHVQPSSDDIGNDEMWWEAHVCLSPPSLPRCCPSGVALTDNLWCSSNNSQHVLTPPIIVEGLVVTWPGETHTQPHQHNCSYTTLSLSSSEAYLKYSPDTVSLVWSPILSQWKEQDTHFCVGVQEDTGHYLVRVCQEPQLRIFNLQSCEGRCMRKCCPESEEFVDNQCVATTNTSIEWNPSFYDLADLSTTVPAPDDLRVLYGTPSCLLLLLNPQVVEEDTFYLLTDGNLYVPIYNEQYPPSNYCIENFTGRDNITHTLALMCFPDVTPMPVCDATTKYVYPVLLLVSCVFLAVTLVTYGSLPDLRKKLNGKCLISLVSALLVGYVCMAVASIVRGKMSPLLCRIIASFMHLTFLAAFFWLNIMCFDIWRTLRKMRTVSGSPEWIRRRFVWYSVYSWGCPLLITIVAVIIEQLPDSYNLIKPDFGTDFCWFQKKRSMWVYFYVYILVLVVANVVFFVMVMVILYRSQNNSTLKRSREVNRERLWLCVKLFLVMGVTWVAEVISFQEGTCQAWIVTDVINTLQGFSIFLVFVCKRSTINMVRTRWGSCCDRTKRKRKTTSSTTTTTTTFSSSGRRRTTTTTTTSANTTTTTGSSIRSGGGSPMIPLQTLREIEQGPNTTPSNTSSDEDEDSRGRKETEERERMRDRNNKDRNKAEEQERMRDRGSEDKKETEEQEKMKDRDSEDRNKAEEQERMRDRDNKDTNKDTKETGEQEKMRDRDNKDTNKDTKETGEQEKMRDRDDEGECERSEVSPPPPDTTETRAMLPHEMIIIPMRTAAERPSTEQTQNVAVDSPLALPLIPPVTNGNNRPPDETDF
ncbi:hypothetical protein Pmani_022632 [Petrolisthes manimaculis]|uniref:G-protein coupled receptors family 2 profile 2 domain-containing protein n=1 Tax=Petrolisthes manimaculis TaxID=1843537 RepID=A0AAE1PDK5_9EUCA|nr:hypothetical protein Pmani_022632 [Petrolisthes manimaculis]